MLLSVLNVFSTAREASQTLKYPLKARNNGPPPKSSDDSGGPVAEVVAMEEVGRAAAPPVDLVVVD